MGHSTGLRTNILKEGSVEKSKRFRQAKNLYDKKKEPLRTNQDTVSKSSNVISQRTSCWSNITSEQAELLLSSHSSIEAYNLFLDREISIYQRTMLNVSYRINN